MSLSSDSQRYSPGDRFAVMTTDSRILTITDAALEKLLEILSTEPDAEDLAFVLAVSGAK